MASRRQYATIADVEQLADVTSTNTTEFEDRISQAEELIDAYLTGDDRHVCGSRSGKLTAVSGTTLYDTSYDTQLYVDDNFFSYCVVEIIGGLGAGQIRSITSSSKEDRSITVSSEFTTEPDTTSVYKIYQLGKFPRDDDVYFEPDSRTYYKSIPEAIKRATAAQVEFVINKGDEFFAGDDSSKESESIDNYSYSRGNGGGQSSIVRFLGPKTRSLLRGYKTSTGRLIAENPTCL